MKPARAIGAAEFKAKCLQLLDRVAKDGGELVVTKHGRPVARVVPVEPAEPRSLRGSVRYRADIVKPLGDEWTVET
jgi:prevent-host-death family protein